ncbi:hypothetical protein JCM10213v2_003129 [Rhodosporidiobolus nylandii]
MLLLTHDITDLTCAELFKKVGTKLRTNEGNWDYVYNTTPVFFLRDPTKFPHFIHTQKRDPQTHLKDPDMFWDYLSLNPEAFHQVMILFSDRGTPKGYRFMHGYSGHTHKLVKEDGSFVHAQFHCVSDQGIKTFTNEEAVKMAGENPDYSNQDLFQAIERGEYPSWTLNVQIMTPEQAEQSGINILDLTKIWPHKDYPLRPVGKLVLNENPKNYFAEIEQIAFAPSHLIHGVEPTADPVLQSRLFSYPDTHRHRLGVNYAQLPINSPINPPANFQRDGAMAFYNQGNRPNYQSSIQPLTYQRNPYDVSEHEQFVGGAIADLSVITEEDFKQPRALWQKVFDDAQRERFVSNVAGHVGGVKSLEVKNRTLACFTAVDKDLGHRLVKALNLQGRTRVPGGPLPREPQEVVGRSRVGRWRELA